MVSVNGDDDVGVGVVVVTSIVTPKRIRLNSSKF